MCDMWQVRVSSRYAAHKNNNTSSERERLEPVFHFMKKMNDGILWGIPYHSWPCPAHHFTDGLTLFRSIAMSGTILASSFLFAILAMSQTTTGKVCQMLILLRHCVLMKMLTTIQLYHLTDCSFLSLNPAHFFIILAK